MPQDGCYYPPTLLTNVSPANITVREEIFGPVLTVMSFRSLDDAVALANNSRYGLASSVWSENINRALEMAAQIKAGIVWVNSANQFDAACGFGGYRESGFGREGGREGMFEYLKPKNDWSNKGGAVIATPEASGTTEPAGFAAIDRTPKMYVGGKQARPDGGNTMAILNHKGEIAGRVGAGNRKDIRNAVEAAFKNTCWAGRTAYNRAQILYYIAENLSIRADEFTARLRDLTGASKAKAAAEVEASISRLFSYGAWADKYDGQVHTPPVRNVALAVKEPIGIMGAVCPDNAPLLNFVSLMAPIIGTGNCVVMIPSERYALIGTDFYQVLETSDVPAGVVNIITGKRDDMAKVLAEHDQVDGLWYHGSAEGAAMVQRASISNLKRTWVNDGKARDWFDIKTGEGRRFLREATQVKNIWLPYGD
ncbi:MAG: aldehyde dehydrogenase family protein [Robiginitomaculum sp.]|nr:aldehyde dehydrogenase family protein [Robiginitomaculum sp.]